MLAHTVPSFTHYYLRKAFLGGGGGGVVAKSCPTLGDPVDCSPPGSSVYGIFQARILEWIAISFSRDLLNPGIEPRSSAMWADSLLSESPGKPKITGVGNLGLLHCRRILYQLMYQGSPIESFMLIMHVYVCEWLSCA